MQPGGLRLDASSDHPREWSGGRQPTTDRLASDRKGVALQKLRIGTRRAIQPVSERKSPIPVLVVPQNACYEPYVANHWDTPCYRFPKCRTFTPASHTRTFQSRWLWLLRTGYCGLQTGVLDAVQAGADPPQSWIVEAKGK